MLEVPKRAFTPDIGAFGSYQYGGRQIDSDYGYQLGVQLQYSNLNMMLLKKQIDEANATYKNMLQIMNRNVKMFIWM